MTYEEIYSGLNQVDPKTWSEVAIILSETTAKNRDIYLTNINKLNPKPIDFLVIAVLEDDLHNRASRHPVGWANLRDLSMFRHTHINLSTSTLLDNLPKQYFSYLPTSVANRLKTKSRDKDIQANTKSIQLNEFSYQVFKAQLAQSKKKLSGKEAIAQIKALPYPTNQLEKEYSDKFLTLFWNHLPKRSIQFCYEIIGKNKNTIYSPVRVIENDYLENVLKETQFSRAEVYMLIYKYQRIAREYNIPVLQEFWTDRHSEHHDWASGVPKSTPLNQIQLEMTVSQILVLDFIITNLQKDSQCPYFTKLKSHLVSEVSKPEYKDALTKLTSQMQTSYTSALKATNGLIQLHNQISTDRKS